MATGCDVSHVTGSDFTGSDVIFPALFSYYSSSTNVPLRMTGSSMATGCDVIKRHVTPKGVPLEGWGERMRNRKLRNIRSNVTCRASPGTGSALGVLSRTSASIIIYEVALLLVICPFHFIFMGCAFNNYI